MHITVHPQSYHFLKKNPSLTKHCISVIQFTHSSNLYLQKRVVRREVRPTAMKVKQRHKMLEVQLESTVTKR